ncbi:MAG: selenium cofactor biosynthesis protein YqeC [Deferrisomatales bacterium]|nr:selenium cofactor biosynthesis protein YqeC [Deferrisomatales bacterium]
MSEYRHSTDPGGEGLRELLGVGKGDLVSLVGGGGKTTCLFRLAGELAAAGVAVAATTTTKIMAPTDQVGVRLICGGSYEALCRALEPPPGPVPVLGLGVMPNGKLEGIAPQWCDRLLGDGAVEALLVEADGARRKPLKAPGSREPVVPDGTTVFVVLVGLSCMGRTLDDSEVFRADRVAAVAGQPLGTPITAETVARLLLSEDGLLRGRPGVAKTVVFLNQADLPGARAAGEAVARKIIAGPTPFDRVILGSLQAAAPALELWYRV